MCALSDNYLEDWLYEIEIVSLMYTLRVTYDAVGQIMLTESLV